MTTHATPADSNRQAQHLVWARKTLGLAEDDSQARRKFLGRLEEEELVPPEELVQAWQTIHDQSQGLFYLGEPAGFLREEAQQLETEVEAYAKEFFELEPPVRIARYSTLDDRTQHAVKARARLKLLARALKLDAVGMLQGRLELQQELGRWLCELFALSPVERAARRAEMLREIDSHRAAWGQAARQLKSRLPAVAALDRALISQISLPAAMPPLEHYEELRETGYLPGAGLTIRQVASGAYFKNAAPAPIVTVRTTRRSSGSYADVFYERVRGKFIWIVVLAVIAVGSAALRNKPPSYPAVSPFDSSPFRLPGAGFPSSDDYGEAVSPPYSPFRLPPAGSGYRSSDELDETVRRLRQEAEWLRKKQKRNEEEEKYGIPIPQAEAPSQSELPPRQEQIPKTLEDFFKSLKTPPSQSGSANPRN
jgi:hypothetical protein